MKYLIEFKANERGAIGYAGQFTRSVDAEDFNSARLMLADDFDHIRVDKVNGEKFDPMNPPS